MSKTFTVQTAGEPRTLLAKAQKAASENGAQLTGDSRRGSFFGDGVNGEYEVIGNAVLVTITKKPFYIPWGAVEKNVMDFFHT